MRYTATARRDGQWWVVQCDQLPAAISQVRRLDRAAETHREAIAFVAGVAEADVEVDLSPVVVEPVSSSRSCVTIASLLSTRASNSVNHFGG